MEIDWDFLKICSASSSDATANTTRLYPNGISRDILNIISQLRERTYTATLLNYNLVLCCQTVYMYSLIQIGYHQEYNAIEGHNASSEKREVMLLASDSSKMTNQ